MSGTDADRVMGRVLARFAALLPHRAGADPEPAALAALNDVLGTWDDYPHGISREQALDAVALAAELAAGLAAGQGWALGVLDVLQEDPGHPVGRAAHLAALNRPGGLLDALLDVACAQERLSDLLDGEAP